MDLTKIQKDGIINTDTLSIKNKEEFRAWLKENSLSKKECFLCLKRGKPVDDNNFYYLDAVEVTLCFGWIDSTAKFKDGMYIQRFSPRTKKSPWTELNKERVRRLERLGLMDETGRKVLPKMGPRSFKINEKVKKALIDARVYSKFKNFPPLYQRVRAYNVAYFIDKDKKTYEKALSNLIENTKKGVMFGNWNDYGRLDS